MDQIFQIGFIGCGNIATEKHFPGMATVDDAAMVAFCDVVPERAAAAARYYGAPDAKTYTDYHELLADPSIDAVHVLTPMETHCRIVIDALEAGKHVLCEKPMATSSVEARAMVDAARRTGKILRLSYQYRHFNKNRIAKQLADDGWLGNIYYAEASWLRYRGVPTWGSFANQTRQSGGPLVDVGTIGLDLVLWMMDNYEVDWVCGSMYQKLGRQLFPAEQGQYNSYGERTPWNPDTFETEDSAFGFIRMKNGASIYLRASWAINSVVKPGMVMLCGDRGGLDTYDQDLVRLNHVIAGEPAITMVGSKPNPMFSFDVNRMPREEAELWVATLRGESDTCATAEQACVVAEILEAIVRSNETGEVIHF